MINITKEGYPFKLGLNLYRAKGGCVAVWVWFDLPKHEVTYRRLRLRLHIKPRFLWNAARFNIIDDYLKARDLELVSRAVLEDLVATEDDVKRINDSLAYIQTVKG
jgi:hypothetical protein